MLFVWILWGISSAILLLNFLEIFKIKESIFYLILLWPFFEEIFKFIIVYFLFLNFKDYIDKYKSFLLWISVWLGFWIYETYWYYNVYKIDFFLILRRLFFIWFFLHWLISWIYWYMLWISYNLPKNITKSKYIFCTFIDFFRLLSYIYNRTLSIKEVFKTIFNIILLDVTLDFIFWNKKSSKYWHWPIELILESFILWLFLHTVYNVFIFISLEHNLFLFIYIFFILLYLYLFLKKLFWTLAYIFFIWIFISFILLFYNIKIIYTNFIWIVFIFFKIFYIFYYKFK